jgi:predicted TIM-barrel fold metal-dependent hydrolase
VKTAEYREYIDPQHREAFDGWITGFEAMVERIWEGIHKAAASGDPTEIERMHTLMDSGLGGAAPRIRALEADGCVGSVIFPGVSFDSVPPFNGLRAPGFELDSSTREQQWAGARAYNRWLADFCSEFPDQFAGVMVLPDLDDVEQAAAEIRAGAAAGLRGGIYLPPLGLQHAAIHDPRYDPLWRTCAEGRMPVNIHAGGQGGDKLLYGDGPLSRFVALAENDFWNRRPLWMMILGGVFERFPELRLVFAEIYASWIPAELEKMEEAFARNFALTGDDIRQSLTLAPREYWLRNGAVGATFMTPHEARMRHEIGLDTIMWGSDYPHPEGTYPFTTECLRHTFHDVPIDEVQTMLGDNAARIYGFDMAKLQVIADRAGPSVEDISRPLTSAEVPKGFRHVQVRQGRETIEAA